MTEYISCKYSKPASCQHIYRQAPKNRYYYYCYIISIKWSETYRLAIETGRWHKPNKIPRNERKCCVCKTLEDEFHFLLECSIYKNLRQKYINKYFWKYPNILKFTELMVSENEITLQRLAILYLKLLN